MKRTVAVDITITPREVEKEIWENMDCVEQVDLLLAMSQRYVRDKNKVLAQIHAVAISARKELSEEEHQNVVHLFEDIVDYLKGESND